MNGVLERYEVKLKQTSKGIWYCDGLTVANADEDAMLEIADHVMTHTEVILAEHNIEEAGPTKNKWAKAAIELQKGINANESLKKEEK